MGLAGRRFLLAAGVACALGLAAWGLYLAVHEPSLGPGAGGADARLNGVWRSRGYGWLWAIGDGRLRVFDESGSLCIARPDVRQSLDGLPGKGLKVSGDGRSFRVALYDPAYRFTFDRIGALPEACTRPADASPMAVIDAIGEIFAAHYAFFQARHVDWPALVAAAKAKVGAETSQEELLQIASALLQNLDDDHVTLLAQINGDRIECDMGGAAVLRRISGTTCAASTEQDDVIERWKRSVWAPEIEDALLDDTARTRANGNITYGLIDGDIGFLSLLSMEDFDASNDDDAAVDEALDEAMALFEDARAVIVDVSLNDGGEDRLARRIAARFAAKRTLAYSKYAGDSRRAPPQAVYVEPSDGSRYTGPVYLMTSNVTVSAAEIFTFAMRALPNVTHVGQPTRGSLSDVLTKQLPNGWRVTLSNEVYLDAAGKAWEGRGIAPTIAIPVFTPSGDAARTHLQAVRAVVDRIR